MEKRNIRFSVYIFIFISCFGCNVGTVNATNIRTAVVDTAESYVGLEEATGKNDGPVERFQKPYGYDKVNWCNLFVKYVYDKNGVPTDGMNGMAISTYQKKYRTKRENVQEGDAVYVKTKYGSGHTGIVQTVHRDRTRSIEGNYSNKVSYVVRKKDKTYYANWIGNQSTTVLKKDKPVEKVKQDTLENNVVTKPNVGTQIRDYVNSKRWNYVRILKYTALLVLIILLFIKTKEDDK